MEINDNKRKYGPIPKPANKIRKNHIGVYLTDAELAELAKRAGTHIPTITEGERSGGDTASRRKLADYIRSAAFGALPPTVPALNEKAWLELAHVLSNLNQIAKKLNTGKIIDDLDREDIETIKHTITALRPKLIESEI